MNEYAEYYKNQAGTGMTVYEGNQYQRGHGFFGTLFSTIIKPLLKYLGRESLKTGVNVGTDLLAGDDFKESFKKNMKLTGNRILDDGTIKMKNFVQKGKGRRRKRRSKKKNKSKKSKKKLNILKKPRKTKSVKKKTSKKSKKRKVRRKRSKRKNIKTKFSIF